MTPGFTKTECLQEQNFPFSKILVGFYTPQRHSLDTLEKSKRPSQLHCSYIRLKTNWFQTLNWKRKYQVNFQNTRPVSPFICHEAFIIMSKCFKQTWVPTPSLFIDSSQRLLWASFLSPHNIYICSCSFRW